MKTGHPLLRLGTRGSLLAVAQSRQVAGMLARARAQTAIELQTITTHGDDDLRTPLDQTDDPGFFSRRIDHALLNGRIDFAVHSLKDLPPARPAGVCRAAILQREDPHDVVVFRHDVLERLRNGQALRIGSSSARRRLPVHEFLRRHLPRTLTETRVQMLNLRGAVDQRLQRLCIDPADRDALDGVVLALAGLSRLWKDPDGRAAIEPVLERARWMVLPLSECPAAPGQGALAVECRASDPALRNALATLHDPVTAAAVEQELDASAALPDKQRSRFAATALPHNRLGAVMFARHRDRRQLFWNRPPRPSWAIAWDGDGWNPVFRRLPLERSRLERPALFIAHWRAAPELPGPDPRTRIWTSGVESWRRLAEHGLWVEGCADHLGFESILPTLNCAVLRLPSLSDWAVLTHEAAVESWAGSGVGQVIASYRLDAGAPPDGDQLSNLRAATHFYWSSPQQYRALAPFPGADAVHACGAGKTADVLCELGIEPVIFPNRSEWRRWLS